MIESFVNVLMILLGFGLVIVVHELGHFAAARWAGVRVFAFAVGFGPAICSWRKGLGFRAGSSEEEARRIGASGDPDAARGVSATEYRLNWFPFGGYVRMLGQEDANPSATSSAPDSYTSVPVWKRMVIISAGVVMNIILAALLFVVVFMAGMREVAPVIGAVVPGSPAAKAGLREGDVVTSIDGKPAVTFSDLQIATAMAGRGDTVRLSVLRGGEALDVGVEPEQGGQMRMMQIGVGPASSRTLFSRPARPSERRVADEVMKQIGFEGVPYGARLEEINGVNVVEPGSDAGPYPLETLEPLHAAARDSGGQPVALGFRGGRGAAGDQLVRAEMKPEAVYPRAVAEISGREPVEGTHVLGLMPLMQADAVLEAGKSSGLVPGDVFLKVGELEYPDVATAVSAIRARAGGSIPLTVERAGGADGPVRVELVADVSAEGTIGFNIREQLNEARVAGGAAGGMGGTGGTGGAKRASWRDDAGAELVSPFGIPGGATVTRVNDTPVSDFASLREALKQAARAGSAGSAPTVSLAFRAAGAERDETATVRLTAAQVAMLNRVEWAVPAQVDAMFQPARVVVRADGPADALMMGVAKTKRVLAMTYLTFLRLFQGTVKVEHLKGPVGIVDLGSRFAEEGFVYVLFFLGLISANLAVVNFLPLPIVDGGLFLMLCYEGLARRPVPVRVQNAVTLAGLALIGTMFLIVTFNDVMSLVR